MKKNIDESVVRDFGDEWESYKQNKLTTEELASAFDQYFHIFPFHKISGNSVGFDMGCGSGRWAQLIAPQCRRLNCIEPSKKALAVAKNNLKEFDNCQFYNASVGEKVLENESQDFGYCLGVLHHVPDTMQGISDCASLLKKGAPFLLYLYYSFENRGVLFRLIWRITDVFRRIISILPFRMKKIICFIIAVTVYFPLSRLAKCLEKLTNRSVSFLPLSDYRNKSFYFMRTDALDRFGTKIEKRFSKKQIVAMLHRCGFEDITFSEKMPYWVCISYKK